MNAYLMKRNAGGFSFAANFSSGELVLGGELGDRPNDSPLPTVAEKGTSRQAKTVDVNSGHEDRHSLPPAFDYL
jgi:hypothetical protein